MENSINMTLNSYNTKQSWTLLKIHSGQFPPYYSWSTIIYNILSNHKNPRILIWIATIDL